MPRLPRKWQVDVAECHACHAKCGGVTEMCDKDGGGQDSEIVVDKDVCEMWKMCVRRVTKMVVHHGRR